MSYKKFGASAAVLGAAAAGLAASSYRSGEHRRHNVTDVEINKTLPGDDLLEKADVQCDRAITINCTADELWPWLVQMGHDKAGFYFSIPVGHINGIHTSPATHISPQWQDLDTGDYLYLADDLALRVALMEENRYLVFTSIGGIIPDDTDATDFGFDVTWGLYVMQRDAQTHLHVRERYWCHDRSKVAKINMATVITNRITVSMLNNLKKNIEG